MITDLEKERFTDYVKDFYSNERDSVYSIASDVEIEEAIEEYFIRLEDGESIEWGGGDSFDRETVRTILDENYSIFLPA